MLMEDNVFARLSANMIIAAYAKEALSEPINIIMTEELDFTPIYLKDGVMFIPFAGTQDWDDILTDLNVRRYKFKKCSIHLGAWERYNLYLPFIVKLIEEHKPKKLVISGHSMGAWVASLLSDHLSSTFLPEDIILNLFASPRIGDLNYHVHFYNNKIRVNSFRNPNDIVPKLPLSLYHIGQRIDVKFINVGKLELLGNHSIDNYLISLDGVYKCTM